MLEADTAHAYGSHGRIGLESHPSISDAKDGKSLPIVRSFVTTVGREKLSQPKYGHLLPRHANKTAPDEKSQPHTDEDICGSQKSLLQDRFTIKFCHQPFDATFADLSNCLSQSDKLDKLKIRNAELNKQRLGTLLELLRENKTKCDSINLSGNRSIDCTVVLSILLQTSAKSLNLSSCNISAPDLATLREYKLEKLNLSYNNLGLPDITEQLRRIVENGLHTLVLTDCNLQPGQVASILSNVDWNMERMDLTHNSEMAEQDYAALGFIASHFGIKELILSGCDIENGKLRTFSESLEDGAKISKLDLSLDDRISAEGMKSLEKIIENAGVEDLDLSYCALTDDHLKALLENDKELQVKRLHLQDNPGLDVSLLMNLATLWNVTCLNLSECRLGVSGISTIVKYLESRKHGFQELDLSEPDNMLTYNMADELACLLRYVEKTLWLCYGEIPCDCTCRLQKEKARMSGDVSVKFRRNSEETSMPL